MGIAVFLAVVLISLALGILVQVGTAPRLRYHWLIVAAAAAFGGYFASEAVVGSYLTGAITQWGPEIEGLFVVPAIVGGALFALVADLGARTTRQPEPA
ncbi:MAG TPA: hypothetical protein VFM93_10875 [Candidatus Limnocylindria bacterium]|nr:hypothetical protein [Candidatus Limnocylindria bacterium]